MKLIVGLGNPELKYEGTRHNIGFEVIDQLISFLGVKFNKEKFNGMFYKKKDLIIAIPLTYMNLSGDFVQAISHFYKIDNKDILIIHDDMDKKVGTITMKPKGGHGGQNGIRDIQTKLGTQDITRIKIGIGRGKNAVSHVLGQFTPLEKTSINKVMPKILDGIKTWIDGDMNKAMLTINTK